VVTDQASASIEAILELVMARANDGVLVDHQLEKYHALDQHCALCQGMHAELAIAHGPIPAHAPAGRSPEVREPLELLDIGPELLLGLPIELSAPGHY
jgi:hypothetical protein